MNSNFFTGVFWRWRNHARFLTFTAMGKPGQSRQAKFREKGESKKKFVLVKMPL
jgi:hypothetical protein